MSIELKHVNYTYMAGTPFEHQALQDVSLTVTEGSFTAIAGHTGSGKSTLVQHLNGLLHPSDGQVLVDGVDLEGHDKAGKKAAHAASQQVGMVFQYAETQLFEETIAEDIAFGPRNQGLTEAAVQERVREAMELTGLDYKMFKDRSPFQLSGGQMRRAAIAGILALHPRYLVLDEPTAGLDPSGRKALIRQIQALHKEWNLTILFVSHSMEDIAQLADSLILMNQGQLIRHHTPLKVFQQTELLASAGLHPPAIMCLMNRIRAAGLPVRTDILRAAEGVRNIREEIQRVK